MFYPCLVEKIVHGSISTIVTLRKRVKTSQANFSLHGISCCRVFLRCRHGNCKRWFQSSCCPCCVRHHNSLCGSENKPAAALTMLWILLIYSAKQRQKVKGLYHKRHIVSWSLVVIICRPAARFEGLGSKIYFRGELLVVFIICLIKVFLGTAKFGRNQKLGRHCHRMPPWWRACQSEYIYIEVGKLIDIPRHRHTTGTSSTWDHDRFFRLQQLLYFLHHDRPLLPRILASRYRWHFPRDQPCPAHSSTRLRMACLANLSNAVPLDCGHTFAGQWSTPVARF